jgi:hypothetical protein
MQEDIITCVAFNMPFVQNNIVVDTLLTIAEITLNMAGSINPLYLSELKFTTVGTANHILPRIRLYRGSNIASSILIGTISNVTSHGEYAFTLSPNNNSILVDGENKFFIVYEIQRPSLSNNYGCGNILSFRLTDFTVQRSSDPNAYSNPVVFPPITRSLEYTPVNFINYGNYPNNQIRTITLCKNEGTPRPINVRGPQNNAVTGVVLGYD